LTKDNVMMVFGIRSDGTLAFGAYPDAPGSTTWHKKFDPIGSSKLAPRSTPAAVGAANFVFAFAIGRFANLRMSFATATATPASMSWTDLVSISGTLAIAPDGTVAAVARKPDTVDVFVIGFDKLLYHTWWTNSRPPTQWEPLQAIGGPAQLAARGGITAVARNENDMHVVVSNEAGQLMTTRWQPGTGWSIFAALP
jgi:hypothetical protein